MSETIPEGVVLTLRTAMKLKTFSVDADTNINFGGKQYKAADVLAIIRKEDGEEDVTSINTRRTKHCFMRVLGLIVSDKQWSDFFKSRLSCSRRELDNKETGKNRGVWARLAEDYRNPEIEVNSL